MRATVAADCSPRRRLVETAPYGSWRSPVTAQTVVDAGTAPGRLWVDGHVLYWQWLRPAEGGGIALMRRLPGGDVDCVLPASFNVRDRVHEYGGGAYAVAEGVVYASRFGEERVYAAAPGAEPRVLSPAGDLRHADLVVDGPRERLVAVEEDHRGGGEPVNRLVAIPLDGGDPQVLVEGNDFYSDPRLSPGGDRLCWLTWNHPDMPWDGTELWTAALDVAGNVENPRRVAGGRDESVLEPRWSPDGMLHFVSDRGGWWNLHREGDGGVEPVCPMAAEFTVPPWAFGNRSYDWVDSGTILATVTRGSVQALLRIDTENGAWTEVPTTSTRFGASTWRWPDGRVVLVAASATEPAAIVLVDPASGATEALWRPWALDIDRGYLSEPQAIDFPTSGGRTAHALYYAPRNRDFAAPDGERPPLLVCSHGGPTASAAAELDLHLQYFTSRGLAVVDVDYGGSTGYGRAYRRSLEGEWGVVDVDDCCAAAEHLVERGLADGRRLCIDGASAGGYTTLAALAFRDLFAAGCSLFGIGDLTTFVHDTHKFESRYLERLVGPYPERADLYEARSPVKHLDGFTCPIVLFQGLDDRVVPPDQSETLHDAVRRRGIPCAYVGFEGEQHGFRQAANIRRALDGELYFFGRVLGFELAGEVEPLEIENLPE